MRMIGNKILEMERWVGLLVVLNVRFYEITTKWKFWTLVKCWSLDRKECNVRLRTEAKKEAMVFFLISHRKFTFLSTTYEWLLQRYQRTKSEEVVDRKVKFVLSLMSDCKQLGSNDIHNCEDRILLQFQLWRQNFTAIPVMKTEFYCNSSL